MALELVKPSDPSFSLPQIHQVMLSCHSNAADPNNNFGQRYQNLRRAREFAQEYQRRTGSNAGISPDLLGTAVERNLLALGQSALAHYARDINANPDKPAVRTTGQQQARIMIELLVQDGLQTRAESYRLFGGEERFNAITQLSPGERAAATDRPGDVISGTPSPAQQANLDKALSAKTGAMDHESLFAALRALNIINNTVESVENSRSVESKLEMPAAGPRKSFKGAGLRE